MAGDWIKIETVTPDKPEVFQIAERLGIDPDAVTGKLIRIWIWADQQTEDGNAHGVTRLLLDRLSGVTGFADALEAVGWLEETEEGLSFVNFDRHNGQTAKKRALTNRRVAQHRKEKRNSNADSNAKSNAESVTQSVTKSVTREEKRREESNNPPVVPPSGGQKNAQAKGTRLPEDWELPQAWRQWAIDETPNIDPDREAAKFRDYWVGKSGAGATKKDWQATWRNWCRNAEERHGKKGGGDWMREAI